MPTALPKGFALDLPYDPAKRGFATNYGLPEGFTLDEPEIPKPAKAVPAALPGYPEVTGKALLRGVEGIAGGIGSVVRWGGDIVGSPEITSLGQDASQYWQNARTEGIAKPHPELWEGSFLDRPSLKRAIGIIAEAAPSMGLAFFTGGLGLAAGLTATGATAVAASTLGLLEGAPQYEEAREAGKDISEATIYGALSTAGTAVLEFIPLRRMLKFKGGRIAGGLKGGAEEALQESTQTIWQNLIAKLGYDDARNLAEGIVESWIGGFGMGGIAGGTLAKLDKATADAQNKGVSRDEIQLATEDIAGQIERSAAALAAAKPDTMAQSIRDFMASPPNSDLRDAAFGNVIRSITETPEVFTEEEFQLPKPYVPTPEEVAPLPVRRPTRRPVAPIAPTVAPIAPVKPKVPPKEEVPGEGVEVLSSKALLQRYPTIPEDFLANIESAEIGPKLISQQKGGRLTASNESSLLHEIGHLREDLLAPTKEHEAKWKGIHEKELEKGPWGDRPGKHGGDPNWMWEDLLTLFGIFHKKHSGIKLSQKDVMAVSRNPKAMKYIAENLSRIEPPAPAKAKAKEPWEMTKEEYRDFRGANAPIESDEFALTHLSKVKTGKPGLSVEKNKLIFRNESGEPVGVTTLRTAAGQKVVDDTAVHPDFRRQGIATKLYEKAKELGHDTGWVENIASANAKHKILVKAQYAKAPETVPANVLAEYPDLAKEPSIIPETVPEKGEVTPEQAIAFEARKKQTRRAELAAEAKDFRTWVRYTGGVNVNDPSWKGEFDDIRWGLKEGKKVPAKGFPATGFWMKTGRGLDERVTDAIEAGWLPEGSTDQDFLEAITSNPTQKPVDFERDIDKLAEKAENEEEQRIIDEYGSDYTENPRYWDALERGFTPQEKENSDRSSAEKVSKENPKIPIDQINFLFKEAAEEEFKLTPSEPVSKKEKLAAQKLLEKGKAPTPRLSAEGEVVKGMSLKSLRQAIAPVQTAFRGVKIALVQNEGQIPKEILKEAKKGREGFRIRGVYGSRRGQETVYLIADNIGTPEDALTVLLHEVVGHAGFRRALRDRAFNDFLTDLYKAKTSDIGSLAKDLKLNTRTRTGREEATEEWFAKAVADGWAESGKVPQPLQTWWDKFVTIFRNWLRKKGFTLKLSDAEIASVMYDAQRAVREGAVPAAEATRFMFVGEKAVTARKTDLDKAVQQEAAAKKNLTPEGYEMKMEQVRRDTGWHLDEADKKWKFEIDDSKMKFKVKDKDIIEDMAYYLDGLIDHPELFKAYPELKNTKVIFKKRTGGEYLAKTLSDPGEIIIGTKSLKGGIQTDTLIHEAQHAVQEIEGFAKGGSPYSSELLSEAGKILREANKKPPSPAWEKMSGKEHVKMARALAYKRLAGEIEAREAALRLPLTAEERRKTPLFRDGIPADQVIVRFGEGVAASEEGAVTIPRRPTRRIPEAKAVKEVAERPEVKKEVEPTEPVIVGSIASKIKSQIKEEPVIPSIFDQQLDNWHGEKDIAVHQDSVEAAVLQDDIRDALGKKRFDKEAQDIDSAIHIYLDLKRNPEHLEKYYSKLKPEDQKIVDLAQTIDDKPELKAIADYIRAQYDELGPKALEEQIIFNVIENYAGRAWKQPKGKAETDKWQKFKTTSRHAKHRVFETILEGQAKGFELAVSGATNNLQLIKDEIARVREDRALIKKMKATEWEDSGLPLLSNTQLNDDYAAIEHPNFTSYGEFPRAVIKGPISKFYGGRNIRVQTKWAVMKEGNKRASKVFDTTKEDAQAYIKEQESPADYKIEERNFIWERTPLFAPKEVAKRLNKILGVSRLRGKPGIDTLTKYNAFFKSTILITGLFHHQAFIRSYLFGTRKKSLAEWNPFKMYKEGVKFVKNQDEDIELLIRNGLTLGRLQDWEEAILQSEATIFGRVMDKTKATKAIKDTLVDLRNRQARFLFQNFGAGLKAKAALIEHRNALKEHPEMDPNKRAAMVADLINDDFGGLHLGRKERDPTIQHIFRLLALAPDWTESNVQTMIKAIRSGDAAKTKLYRKFWVSVITKGMTATFVANLLFALGGDDDEEELQTFKKAWNAGNFKWLDIDVTPLYKITGGEASARKYFSVFGHFRDPLKFIIHPIRSFHHKGSVVYRMMHELVAGTDWRGQGFTSLSEFLGVDDRGIYLTTRKGRHRMGEPKGGKDVGKLTSIRARKGPVSIPRLPSYMIAQARGWTPIQVQNFLGWMSGEIEGWDALSKSGGFHTQTTYPSERKVLVDFVEEYKKRRENKESILPLRKQIATHNVREKSRREEAIIVPWSKVVRRAQKELASERIAERRQ